MPQTLWSVVQLCWAQEPSERLVASKVPTALRNGLDTGNLEHVLELMHQALDALVRANLVNYPRKIRTLTLS